MVFTILAHTLSVYSSCSSSSFICKLHYKVACKENEGNAEFVKLHLSLIGCKLHGINQLQTLEYL